MDRVIKFRAVCKYDNKFKYGSLVLLKNGDILIVNEPNEALCDKQTLSQFTGFFDVNKKEIYEDDIVVYMKVEWRVIMDKFGTWFLKQIPIGEKFTYPAILVAFSRVTSIELGVEIRRNVYMVGATQKLISNQSNG